MWYDPLSHSQVIYEHNRKMFVVTHGSELYIYCTVVVYSNSMSLYVIGC